MKQELLNWVDTYLIEIILGVCLVLVVIGCLWAVQLDQYLTDKCEGAGGTLFTTSDSQYICIQKNATIQL